MKLVLVGLCLFLCFDSTLGSVADAGAKGLAGRAMAPEDMPDTNAANNTPTLIKEAVPKIASGLLALGFMPALYVIAFDPKLKLPSQTHRALAIGFYFLVVVGGKQILRLPYVMKLATATSKLKIALFVFLCAYLITSGYAYVKTGAGDEKHAGARFIMTMLSAFLFCFLVSVFLYIYASDVAITNQDDILQHSVLFLVQWISLIFNLSYLFYKVYATIVVWSSLKSSAELAYDTQSMFDLLFAAAAVGDSTGAFWESARGLQGNGGFCKLSNLKASLPQGTGILCTRAGPQVSDGETCLVICPDQTVPHLATCAQTGFAGADWNNAGDNLCLVTPDVTTSRVLNGK
eukprot:c32563_g1_i1.p1 GENE.c32563_g1_i1~~c32563_g1_i1.p1  ORF type:complete len:347 (-),score=40.28 c32563_g1_i1:37-1077(-)